MELSTAGCEEGEKENAAALREVTLAPAATPGPSFPFSNPQG